MLNHNQFIQLSDKEKREVLQRMQQLVQDKELYADSGTSVQAGNAGSDRERYSPFPLSDMQESFSVGKFFGGATDRVGCHIYFELEEYDLDVSKLTSAWNQLIAYHEMLQTVVLANRSQRLLEQVPEYVPQVFDLTGSGQEEMDRHIGDMRLRMSHKLYETDEWPLFEICVSRLNQGRHIIHFSIDEWLVDGFSMATLFKQWYQLYRNPSCKLPPLEFTFREYMLYQHNQEGSPRYKRDLAYWMEKYAEVPNGPSLPYNLNPAKPSGQPYYERKRYQHVFGKEDWTRLKNMSRDMGISQTALLILCFSELLSYWSEDDAFSIILTYFNRPPVHPQIDQVVGPFVSTNIFTIKHVRQLSLKAKAKSYQQKLWEDLDYSSVSGIRALRELRVRSKQSPALSIPIVFTSMLNNAGRAAEDSWLAKTVYSISQTPQVCLDHQVYEQDGQLTVMWDAVEQYFQPGTLAGMFAEYVNIIKQLANLNDWDKISLKDKLRGPLPLAAIASPAGRYDRFRLSDMQQAQLFGRLNYKAACRMYQEFELEGLDVTRLQHAWNRVVGAHDMLRAVINENGTQQVLESVPEYVISVYSHKQSDYEEDHRAAERIRQDKQQIELPLNKWPLFDLSVSLWKGNKARIHLTIDALIADGNSIAMLYHDLFKIYVTPDASLEEAGVNYRDYLEALDRFRKSDEGKAMAAYWKEKMTDLPSGPLLPSTEGGGTERGHRRLEGRIHNWRAFKRKAEELSIEPGILLFAAYAQVLEERSKQGPFTIVFVDWSRPAVHPDIQRVVGDFTSLSWVVIRPSGLSFAQRVRTLQASIRNDLARSAVSGLGELRKKLMLASTDAPLSFPVVFTNSIAGGALPMPPEVSVGFGQSATPGVYLDNMSLEREDSLWIQWDYDASVLPPEIAEAMFERYHGLLTDLAHDPDLCVPDQPNLLSGPVGCIHSLFENQVERNPHAVALTFKGSQITYGELNKRANRLAHYLRRQGAGPEVMVGLCMERSFELLIAILAILKSGGAYIPLDPHSPKDRLSLIIEDASLPMIITRTRHMPELPELAQAQFICLDLLEQELAEEDDRNPESGVNGDNVSYVIYTSGSTGKPKGALIPHSNVVRLFSSTEAWFSFRETDVWTMFHSYAFDFSVWEMWGALLHGGRLVIVPYAVSRSFDQFYRLVAAEGVTVLNQTPTAFKQFMLTEDRLEHPGALSLRYVIFGGEALNPQSLAPWFQRHGDQKPRLINMYGITETTVHVTYRQITREDLSSKTSVIGTPIPDLQLYILDDQLRQVPTGTSGELYVGGKGLARGYLNRPSLTEERFIPNPFSTEPGSRLYKTGDAALRLPGGDVEYLGRMDLQVKVRGFRIELGEIETALLKMGEIRQAVVAVQDKDTDDPKIVAYLICADREAPTAKEVRQYVRGTLPDYMVPNVIARITELPLTENGKLNRDALPWPIPTGEAEKPFRTDGGYQGLLRGLMDIFREALDTEDEVTATDDIFDLGATSLTLMTANQLIAERYEVTVPIEIYFSNPAIQDIAAYIHGNTAGGSPLMQEPGPAAAATTSTEGNPPDIEIKQDAPAARTSITEQLLGMFREALETEENIQVSDDLFDIGTTSLTIMTVSRMVEEKYKVTIPMDLFFRSPTIEDVAQFIADETMADPSGSSFRLPEDAGRLIAVSASAVEEKPAQTVQLQASPFKKMFYRFASSKHLFEQKQISFDVFSAFLALLKMEKVKGDSRFLYPSSGGRNGVQTYVYIKDGGVEGLEGGLYYYHPLTHELYLICKPFKMDSSVHMELNRPVFEQSAFSIFFIAQLNALRPVYVDYSESLAKLDTGYMAQLMMNRQHEFNIGLYPAIGLDFESIAGSFRLDGGHRYIFSLMGGYFDYRAADTKLFDEAAFVQTLRDRRFDIAGHFRARPVYETAEDILRIQRERKFNILSRKELVQLTREQPHIRKFNEADERIALAPYQWDPSYYTLRASRRHYKNAPVSFCQFSKWLSTLGKEEIDSLEKGLYTPPGGVSGLKIYIYAKENGVEDLQEGVYAYHRDKNALTMVSAGLSEPIRACHTPFNIKISVEAKFFIFLVSDLSESRILLGGGCTVYAQLESGMIGQVLMDRQAECGIGTVPIGGMDFDKIARDFAIGDGDIYIHSFMCGSVDFEEERDPGYVLEENGAAPNLLKEGAVWEIEAETAVQAEERPGLPVQQGNLHFPLSLGQQSLFFVHCSYPESAAYNTAYHVRIRIPLRLELFKRALEFLVFKHPLLRTTFAIIEGEETQIVHDHYDPPIELIDASGWDEARLTAENIKEYRVPFRLTEQPGFRVVLFRISDNDHVLLFNIHHIITDFTSTGLMVQDLWTFYGKLMNDPSTIPVTAPDMRYFDYIAWQRMQLDGEEGTRMWKYWESQLGGELPVLDLPTDKPRPPIQTSSGATLNFSIDKTLTDELVKFSRKEKKTLYTVVLAAFQVLLHRYSGQEDVIVGTTASARGPLRFQDASGYFINPLVIRADLSGKPTFREALERISQTMYSALDNQNYPFSLMVKQLKPVRDFSRSPVFQVTFQLLSQNMSAKMNGGDGAVELYEIPQQEGQFDLELELMEGTDGMKGRLAYNKDLWYESTMERFQAHLVNLLREIIADPERKLLSYDFLGQEEKRLLLETWNNEGRTYLSKQSINQLFEQQAEQHKNEIAVTAGGTGDQSLSIRYGELNARANRLAYFLRSIYPQAGGVVGICLEKSIETVVSVLAVFKAGCAYVPIDPAYPRDRIEFIAGDSNAVIIITTSDMEPNFDPKQTTVICLDKIQDRLYRFDDANPDDPPQPESLAYVIYTSGSTGTPKGVGITHGSAVNIFCGYRDVYLLERNNRTHLQMAAFTFDVFIGDLMRALCSGGRLVLSPREYVIDPERLHRLIVEENIHIAEFVPAVMRHLVQYMKEKDIMMNTMNTVIISSDSWNMKDLNEFRRYFGKETRFINAYGVTEVTIDSTYIDCADLDPDIQGFVPIGRPFPNTDIYIVDPELKLVPIGVVGELCIGGKGVATGYMNRPALTAEKFVVNPFRQGGNERMYRSGDMARYLPDGSIEFLGRADYQVKVRGLRIEVGEIEEVLVRHPSVGEAVVLAKQDQTGESILIGYYTEAVPGNLSLDELQNYVRSKLPEYMVPTIFIRLDAFPLTSNRKIDRKALPAPDSASKVSMRDIVQPATEMERRMTAIWKRVLQLENLGVTNDFFQVGGHSFLAIKLLDELKRELQSDISLMEFLENPTIRYMARRFDRVEKDVWKEEESWTGSLEEDAKHTEAAYPEWYRPRNIFLTGATGHLGIYLLVNLLDLYETAVVHCLIRARNEDEARDKLEHTLRKYLLWREKLLDRVIPVVGDLEKPLLGLDCAQYDELARNMDIIFHNGAYVNFAYPYEVLKKANVNGTAEVLKLASRTRIKPMHYISTTSVFENTEVRSGIFQREIVIGDNTELVYNKKLDRALGYTQSKWVAEKLVQRAREQGMLITIYRPDVISGHSETGIWNNNDFAAKTLQSIADTGLIPKGRFKFNWLPVETASQAIVRLSSLPKCLNRNFNLASPYSFELRDLAEWLTEAGFPVKELPFHAWRRQMEELQAKASVSEDIPEEVWKAAENQDPRAMQVYDLKNLTVALRDTDIKFEPINKNHISKYVEYFIQSGYLKKK
ncbi:non-ribosomal peptide synthetase (plasmid) [Paenibacillus sonchi]|uniref:Non-ribosomal peptide synthetase n=1 Tax=Paenibacillus sonchi TaxID=373687 RepID=A0A974PJJ2_9BACL|nr:non-ribosomal peptide synthetase [Paenibacillus sonchi]QQZ64668.1 non-ribosomal peptide synthetase [Paenibacillus sonchi]